MDKVTISNLQGESGLANVIRYFLNNGTEYLIYSLNEVDEAGYTRLYVTKMNGVDGNYTAESLNDTEWAEIKNLVKVIVKANKENLPLPIQDINPKKINNIILKDKKIFKLNTPLVNDLGANKPIFDNNDETSSGEQKSAFDMPGTQTFETPVQPTFDIPGAQTFETPVQPTFDMPGTQTFETPVQPTFDMPGTQTFETPVQPTFDMPGTQTFETPVQPTFDMPGTQTFETPVQPTFETPISNNMNNDTFDFANMNTFDSTLQSQINNQTSTNFAQTNNENELQDEIKRLQEELAKYKSIVENVKNIIEK